MEVIIKEELGISREEESGKGKVGGNFMAVNFFHLFTGKMDA
jgi:hypothetical protein